MTHFRPYVNVPDLGISPEFLANPSPSVNGQFAEGGEEELDDLFDLATSLPSNVANDIDDSYFKNSSKETFLSALQRASLIYRQDFLKYRPLGVEASAVSSPSLESPHSHLSIAASRDSVLPRPTRSVFLSADLRPSAVRRKALHTVVESVIDSKSNNNNTYNRYVPWNSTLEQVRSYFGRAAASYFSLIRFLFILNVFISFIVFFLLVLPYLVTSTAPNLPIENTGECEEKMRQLSWVMCNDTYVDLFLKCSREFRQVLSETNRNASWISHVTNVLRGQGYLTLSPLYYAYYSDILFQKRGGNGDVFPGGLVYFCVIGLAFTISFFSLLVLSYKAVVENGPHRTEDFHYHFSSVVFAGWDHITSTKFACDMRLATLRRFLKMELERVLRRMATDKLSGFAIVRLWLVRTLLMLISLAVIVGGIVLILISSSCAQIHLDATGESSENWFGSLAADFLPAAVVVILNTFQPDVFVALAKFENYSPETEIKLILLRLIVSRFATVITFMVPLLGFQLKEVCPVRASSENSTRNVTSDFSCAVIKLEQTMGQKSYCWEANVGEQLYKIVFTDLITVILVTFGYSFLRRILVEKVGRFERFRFLKKVGRREFELPVEVINLFYIQTICWMGVYFMPLLPVFAALSRFVLFYLKRWDLQANTFLTWRVRAADTVQAFYMAYLCGCFIVALAFTGYASSVIMTSPGCGPFAMANNNSALSTVFDELRAQSPAAGDAADNLGHPLLAGSFVTAVSFVAICCHLYAMSTKRRVKAIRALIAAERQIRDYYFSQIANSRISNGSSNNNPTNSRIISTLQHLDGVSPTVSVPRIRQVPGRYQQSRHLANLPSTYGPDFAFGSGIYDLRRQISRF